MGKSPLDTFLVNLAVYRPIRLLLAGPAGVGKSRFANMIHQQYGVMIIEHDSLKDKSDPSDPCEPRSFDPFHCFLPVISRVEEFVLDAAGGAIFRRDANNEARLARMLAFKSEMHLTVVLLTAPQDVVHGRYTNCKGGTDNGFLQDWHDWESFEQPYWRQCRDTELDATQ